MPLPGTSNDCAVKMLYHPYDYEKYPVRKKKRLQSYDYSTSNYYFVTICTHEKQCIFGNINEKNDFGRIVEKSIEEIQVHFPDAIVDKFVVMPNHIHFIFYLQGGKSSLEHVVGSFKSYVTKQIHAIDPHCLVWQKSFHDHIIRDEKSYQNIWLYIESNPMNWEKDCFYRT